MKLFLTTTDSILIGIFLLSSLLYVALIHKLPLPLDYVLKAIPALSLAVMCYLYVPGLAGGMLTAGFVMSALGDVALNMHGHKPEMEEQFFIMGLASFLVAHVFYVIAFAQDYQYSPSSLPWLALVAVFGIVMAVILYPKLGSMKVPVFAYISVILTMAVFAVLRINMGWVLIPGAILFILSDSTIAINKFLYPFEGSRYVIMVTYYAGQFLIARAFVGVVGGGG